MAVAPQTMFRHQTPTRKQLKDRATRAEAKVKKAVRAACVERDGYCITSRLRIHVPFGPCAGRSTFAHLAGHRRSGTRNQPAHVRHNTKRAGMLCEFHHECEEHRGLRFIPLNADLGMDGPISWAVSAPKTQRSPNL